MKATNKPFFSVVIPLYNKENYIKETLQSVIQQSFTDFEVIVVNDGSTDRSVLVTQEINDPRLKIIEQENGGVSKARNTGIQNASADYIAFLDADDLWENTFLEEINALISDFPTAGLYATSYCYQTRNGAKQQLQIEKLPKDFKKGIIPDYFKVMTSKHNFAWTSAVCIRKDIFYNDEIWFPVGEKYGEDQYVWAAVAVKHQVAYSTKNCAVYNIEAENNTVKDTNNAMEPHGSFFMIRDLRNTISDPKLLESFDSYCSKLFYSFALKNMLYGVKKRGFEQLVSYKLSPEHKIKLLIAFLIPRFFTHLFIKIKYGKKEV